MLKPVALALVRRSSRSRSPDARAAAPDNADDGVVRIVASTNVYGDIARSVGGADVEVTSVIDDPAQDPHEFEANARVQLALSRGRHRDRQRRRLRRLHATRCSTASGNDDAIVIDAVERLGLDADARRLQRARLVRLRRDDRGRRRSSPRALGEVDPTNARASTRAPPSSADRRSSSRSARRATTRARRSPARARSSPSRCRCYLLDAMGLDESHPARVQRGDRGGHRRPARPAAGACSNLIGDGSAALVVYNAQTGGPQTDAVLDVAERRPGAGGRGDRDPARRACTTSSGSTGLQRPDRRRRCDD